MTIQQCKYVLEIAKRGSFSEAAKQLFIAQSGLSSSIKQLEGELGIKIFERSKNGVFLSPEGAEFVRYAEQLVEQNDFIIERFAAPKVKERLYISSQHYDFIADIFCRFVRECDEEAYDFSLRELKTYEVIHDVECAHSDIGFIAIKESDFDVMSRYLSNKGLVFTSVLKASPHAYLRAAHPLAGRETLSYEELGVFPYVSYEQGSHSGSLFTEEIADTFECGRHILISDRATLMNVLMSTDGYTVGTGIMPSVLNDGKIICIPVDSDEFYHLGYILKHDRRRSPLTKDFIELLDEFAERK